MGEPDSVAAAMAAAARLEPSVPIDVELPHSDGIALARELAAPPGWLTSIDGDITSTDEAQGCGRAHS
jgi:hypothetical protein